MRTILKVNKLDNNKVWCKNGSSGKEIIIPISKVKFITTDKSFVELKKY